MNVKYIKNWTIDNLKAKSPVDHDGHNLTLVGDDDDISPCLIIEQDDVGINESQEIRDIAADYHRRLQEQVTLAKQDIVQELENHIQVSDKKMRFCHILFVELLVGMMIWDMRMYYSSPASSRITMWMLKVKVEDSGNMKWKT